MYDKKFAFTVEIDGITSGAFKTCSELSVEIEKGEIREGGRINPIKEPTIASIPDVTLERGKINDKELYEWTRDVVDLVSGLGRASDENVKRNMDIVQRDRNGEEIRRYHCYGVFPVKFIAGTWDNDSNEIQVESITLSIDSWE